MRKLIILMSLFITTVYAAPHCPHVTKIQEVGLSNNLVQDANGKWYAGRTSQDYGTPVKWTFVIGGISAPDKHKAILEANEALSTLHYKSGPHESPADKWLCLYENDDDFPSGAITPPINRIRPIRN